MSDDTIEDQRWGRDLRDIFLLSIIDAYPLNGGDRQVRLDKAKEALFGESANSKTKKIIEDDDAALRHMARGHLRDLYLSSLPYEHRARQGFSKARPVIHLAHEAAHLAQNTWGDNPVERLRKRFAKEKAKWLNIEQYHDDVSETQQYNIMLEAKELLARIDIKMEIDYAARSLHPNTKRFDEKK